MRRPAKNLWECAQQTERKHPHSRGSTYLVALAGAVVALEVEALTLYATLSFLARDHVGLSDALPGDCALHKAGRALETSVLMLARAFIAVEGLALDASDKRMIEAVPRRLWIEQRMSTGDRPGVSMQRTSRHSASLL